MRHIDKSKSCPDFEDFLSQYGQRLHGDWGKIKKITTKSSNRERIMIGQQVLLILFTHLRNEQKGLCIYCEQLIPEKTAINRVDYKYAHIEHVQKQELHPDLVFVQSNLSISCNGFDCDIEVIVDDIPIKEFCGHYKDNPTYNPTVFDDNRFLSPLKVEDIETYFDYDVEDNQMRIVPNSNCSNEQQDKTKFTIDVLGLQHPTLCEMLMNAYDMMLDKLQNGIDIAEELSDEYDILPAFYSMLKNKFL